MDKTATTVLMVSVQWPPETFIDRTARGLAAGGTRVLLAVSWRPGQVRRQPVDSPFEIVDLPPWNESAIRRAITLLSLFVTKLVRHPKGVINLARRLRQATGEPKRSSRAKRWYRLLPFVGLNPTVVHFQWNSAAIDNQELFDLFTCPTVVSCRGSQVVVAPHNPKRRERLVSGLRRTLGAASRIHCVSEDIRRVALNHGGAAEKTVVIRPAVDADFFSPASASNGRRPRAPFRIVTIGSLVWVKDHESALTAIAQLVHSGVAATFEICGDGPDRQAVEYTAADLGIAHCVTLRGRLSPVECRDALRNADVFVLSSVAEGISNAVLEAMACGLPVVSTDCGGMREAVRDGVDGFLVRPRNPAAIAGALGRLAADETLRGRMGSSARQRVLDLFTLDRQVGDFRTLYATAINAGR